MAGLVLSTKVDTSGISKGVSEISGKLSLVGRGSGSLKQLTDAIKDQKVALRETKKEWANLVAQGKGNGAEAEKLKKKATELTGELIEMGEAAEELGENCLGKLSKGLTSAQKAMLAVATAVVSAIAKITTEAVKTYADYEQQVGGVETLFGSASDKVIAYAQEAYKTAGVSANEYMKNVTSFSASLLKSVAGDTDRAAEIANQAMIDMSDNANKMGTDMASIQNAYQGFAKQNYTMLDNLKLGYGGTKTEMQRLLAEAQAVTGVKYDISNLSDVYEAIHVIQGELGITGTTAEEASTTITGAANATKAAWDNVLTALAGGGDLDAALDGLNESLKNLTGRLAPTIRNVLKSIGSMVSEFAPTLVQELTAGIISTLPKMIDAILDTVVNSVFGALKGLLAGIGGAITGAIFGDGEAEAEVTTNTQQAVNEQKNLADATEETNEAANVGLASFDEINSVNKETSESESGTAAFGVGGGDGDDGNTLVKDTKSLLETILDTCETLCMAIGIILLLKGKTTLGIGFIVAGFIIWGIKDEALEAFNSGEPRAILDLVLASLKTVALAIGVILLLKGKVWLGIGFIVFGFFVWAIEETEEAAYDPANADATLQQVMAYAGLAIAALGIILICFGQIPWGIGALVVGIVAFGVSELTAHWGEMSAETQNMISIIMAIAGTALLVLGVILICCGLIPLGIAALATGVVLLVATFVLNKDAIIDWIKGVWNGIKNFWNKYIKPIFTAEFWLNLAKKAGNGLISGFEAAVNGVISLFEGMVNFVIRGLNLFIGGLDTIVGAVGSIFGADWGVSKIQEVSFSRVKFPRLAEGAVIPANREFLAVLGDQKHGTNIEAPLDTIKQAVYDVLRDSGRLDTDKTIVVPIYIDGREVLRAVKNAEKAVGTQTVAGGFAYAH